MRYLAVQKIKNTPISKVSSASVGLVALAGRARLYQPQLSPVSGVPCSYWRIFVSYYETGKNRGWEGFYNAASKLPLSLEDETGRIPVLPEGATIEIPSNISFEGYIRERGLVIKEPATMDPRVLKFIETLDAETQEIFAQHHESNIMLNEYVIHENDPLFVMGSALPSVDLPGFEDETLVVRQGPNDSTMYISESSEAAFMNMMTGHMYIQIIAGLALSAICLYLFQYIGGN